MPKTVAPISTKSSDREGSERCLNRCFLESLKMMIGIPANLNNPSCSNSNSRERHNYVHYKSITKEVVIMGKEVVIMGKEEYM